MVAREHLVHQLAADILAGAEVSEDVVRRPGFGDGAPAQRLVRDTGRNRRNAPRRDFEQVAQAPRSAAISTGKA
ncbi:MAG: hypothetical protein IPI85_09860 [Dehalococcoidia bacterium]|nr:hypothetical protein [Dehalococcoidia bacterium]